jgi:hypothetical protein
MRTGTATTLGRVGSLVLITITGLTLVSDAIGIGYLASSSAERQMYVGYAAADALALLVVVFAYPRRELWAWWAVWAFVAAVVASIPLSGGNSGIASLASALGLTLGQLLVARDVLARSGPIEATTRSDVDPARDRRIRLRTAGVLSLLVGLGFGVPAAYGAWYFASYDQVWRNGGEPTNGDGPFVQWGIANSALLDVAFVAVCTLGAVCGVLLLTLRRPGPVLAVALLPLELFFWIGFALPFAFPLGIARVVLVLWPVRRRVSSAG